MKIFAHRGCTHGYPENTRPAFRAALESGIDGIEFDVRLSRDGAVMVLHDDRIDRTSDGTGAVADLTLDQLRRVDAGGWYDKRFRGERLLTLDEVLEMLGDRLELNIHIKAVNDGAQDLVAGCVSCLVEHGRLQSAYLTGDEANVRLARRLRADVRVSCLAPHPRNTQAAVDTALAAGSCVMQVGHGAIDGDFVQLAHSHGLPILAMYLGAAARDVDEMARLQRCGVDGLLLDHVDVWQSSTETHPAVSGGIR